MNMGRMAAVQAAGDLSSLFGISKATEATTTNTIDVGGGLGATTRLGQPDPQPDEAKSDESAEAAPEGSQEAQESTEEGEQEPEAKPEPQKPQASVAEINKAFRELRRMEKAVKADRQAVMSLKQELEAKSERLKELESLDKLNDMDTLKLIAERKGLSLNSYLRNIIYQVSTGQEAPQEEEKKDEKPVEVSPEIAALREEITKLNSKLENKEKAELEAQEQYLVDSYLESALEVLNDDDFPLLTEEDPVYLRSVVEKKANDYAAQTGEAPDPRELMEYLETVWEKEATAMATRLQKKQSRVKNSNDATTSPEATPQGSGSPATSKKVEKAPVLSNGSVVERSVGKDPKKMSDRERLSEAARYLASQRRA